MTAYRCCQSRLLQLSLHPSRPALRAAASGGRPRPAATRRDLGSRPQRVAPTFGLILLTGAMLFSPASAIAQTGPQATTTTASTTSTITTTSVESRPRENSSPSIAGPIIGAIIGAIGVIYGVTRRIRYDSKAARRTEMTTRHDKQQERLVATHSSERQQQERQHDAERREAQHEQAAQKATLKEHHQFDARRIEEIQSAERASMADRHDRERADLASRHSSQREQLDRNREVAIGPFRDRVHDLNSLYDVVKYAQLAIQESMLLADPEAHPSSLPETRFRDLQQHPNVEEMNEELRRGLAELIGFSTRYSRSQLTQDDKKRLLVDARNSAIAFAPKLDSYGMQLKKEIQEMQDELSLLRLKYVEEQRRLDRAQEQEEAQLLQRHQDERRLMGQDHSNTLSRLLEGHRQEVADLGVHQEEALAAIRERQREEVAALYEKQGGEVTELDDRQKEERSADELDR
jgi:hypothetical protein